MTAHERWRQAEPEAQPATLTVRGLTVSYMTPGGEVSPIRGLDLEVQPGSIVGLIGDAGSGKSTLALALLGLVRPPGRIVAGQVAFEGRDLLALSADEQRRIRGKDMAVVVQNPRAALNPLLPIGLQIALAVETHLSVGRREARRRAVELLRDVGINDPERRVNAYPHELSGGMAQRALIAMAMAARPRLLIADEPTSGLDVTIQAQFLDQMWRTVKASGSTALLIAKELGIIANYCDRVVVLHEGRIVEDQPTKAFFLRPQTAYSRTILNLAAEESTPVRPADAGKPLIDVAGLSMQFPVRGSGKVVQAVSDVSLQIGDGEALGLVGESGSGKTTVGRCVVNLIEPSAGHVTFRGRDLARLAPAELRRARAKLQIVFQDPFDSVNPRWTIRQILEEPLRLHGRLGRKARQERGAALLDMVGLSPALLDRRPRGLGAGAMQRLTIARALATEPDFIVLDEPTSVLSPLAVVSLIALLRRVQRELKVGYLFISHDLTTVRYVCQRVAVMYLGQIVELGTVEQVFARPLHPYSRALLSAHLTPDPTRRRVDRAVEDRLEGEIPSPIDLPKGCFLASRCPAVQPRCRAEPQNLSDVSDGRLVRCWRVAAGELSMT